MPRQARDKDFSPERSRATPHRPPAPHPRPASSFASPSSARAHSLPVTPAPSACLRAAFHGGFKLLRDKTLGKPSQTSRNNSGPKVVGRRPCIQGRRRWLAGVTGDWRSANDRGHGRYKRLAEHSRVTGNGRPPEPLGTRAGGRPRTLRDEGRGRPAKVRGRGRCKAGRTPGAAQDGEADRTLGVQQGCGFGRTLGVQQGGEAGRTLGVQQGCGLGRVLGARGAGRGGKAGRTFGVTGVRGRSNIRGYAGWRQAKRNGWLAGQVSRAATTDSDGCRPSVAPSVTGDKAGRVLR